MDNFHEELVSISLIRSHTKTDDVLAVTDEQLMLYRQAAIEAAEKYTGFRFGALRDETVRLPYKNSNKRFVSYTLPYRSAGEYIYWREGRDQGSAVVEKDARKFKIQNMFYNAGIDNCCSPCGSTHNAGVTAVYKSGFGCAGDVPANIKLGILKFIAWSVTNAGDEIVTIFTGENRINSTSSYGIAGSNNAAWASGALELWRLFDDDA